MYLIILSTMFSSQILWWTFGAIYCVSRFFKDCLGNEYTVGNKQANSWFLSQEWLELDFKVFKLMNSKFMASLVNQMLWQDGMFCMYLLKWAKWVPYFYLRHALYVVTDSCSSSLFKVTILVVRWKSAYFLVNLFKRPSWNHSLLHVDFYFIFSLWPRQYMWVLYVVIKIMLKWWSLSFKMHLIAMWFKTIIKLIFISFVASVLSQLMLAI